MVVVMMMPMSHHDDPWRIATIRVMMMVVVIPRQLHIAFGGFCLALFIDRLQKLHRIRNRFE